jgi:hypothetical protein
MTQVTATLEKKFVFRAIERITKASIGRVKNGSIIDMLFHAKRVSENGHSSRVP